MRQSSSACLIGVTEAESGHGRLLNINEYPDPVKILEASTWMPGVCPGTISIGGEEFVDGAVGFPFQFERIIEDYSLTHLLVIPNGTHSKQATLFSNLTNIVYMPLCKKYSPELRLAIRMRHKRYDLGIKSFRNLIAKGFIGGIIWTDNAVKPFTRNPVILKSAADRAEYFTLDLIRKHT